MQQSTSGSNREAHPRLESERLVLRPIRVDDSAAYQSYRGLDDVVRYLTHDALSREAAESRLGQSVAFWQAYPAEWFNANFAVELADAGTNRGIIGDLKAWNLLPDGSGPATENPHIFWIGYAFHPEMQGKGYASEATARIIRWLFEEHNATEVRAIVWAPNVASKNLLMRVGLRVFREFPPEHEEHPTKLAALHLRLFREEWLAANTTTAATSTSPTRTEES